jgi:hypothetical protein
LDEESLLDVVDGKFQEITTEPKLLVLEVDGKDNQRGLWADSQE